MAQTANRGAARPAHELICEVIRFCVARLYAEATPEHRKAKAAGDVEGALHWLTRRETLLDVLEIVAAPGAEAGSKRER